MLIAGDFDEMKVILDYYANIEKLLSPRTLLYWNHTGMWTTETHHLSGAYTMGDYGCDRPAGYPVELEQSGYLHLDQGGDSGTGEYSLMVLDYFLWTNDTEALVPYLSIATQAAAYLMHHFSNRSDDGKVIVWPAQVLETWWCDYDVGVGIQNCCADDSPTISAMHILFEKLLALPVSITNAADRLAWTQFQQILPDLPVINNIIAPARVLSNGVHNDEGPELYAIHPHRLYTKGRAVATGLDISIGLATFYASKFATENSGWNYGLNVAALLGIADVAMENALARALTPPASGYRFQGFAPHMQDFDPSAGIFF